MDSGISTHAPARRGEFSGLSRLPYLSSGTSIATEDGQVPAGWIRAGDLVVTRDRGLQPVLAIGLVEDVFASCRDNPALWPVEIMPGALGRGMPEARLVVSASHKILVRGPEVELHFGLTEAMVPARYLIGWPGIESVAPTAELTGYQLLFERHEAILADGQWVESLHMDRDAVEDVTASAPGAMKGFDGHRHLVRVVLGERETALLIPPANFAAEKVRITA